jgi:cysteine synthase A
VSAAQTGTVVDFRNREWRDHALGVMVAEQQRCADTNLLRLPLPEHWGVSIYLKDESTHPSGSLKHRLARSLITYALCSGWIGPTTTLVEASSGSTAISEAYFARLLGLDFVAVVPASTSPAKLAEIRRHGGECHLVQTGGDVYATAAQLAEESGGHYLDQFTYAERAVDWRGNNNIAESILDQMRLEVSSEPSWVVVGAGTGGTSATIGRYLQWRRIQTKLCVVDSEFSVFRDYFLSGDSSLRCARPSRIEGIGRPRVEPSFIRGVIDRMEVVPDAASVAAMELVRRQLGRWVGPSTGTNVVGALLLATEMRTQGRRGAIATLICDAADRYQDTVLSPSWLSANGLDPSPHLEALVATVDTGHWHDLPS